MTETEPNPLIENSACHCPHAVRMERTDLGREQYETLREVCCHCGQQRAVYSAFVMSQPDGHGSYAPDNCKRLVEMRGTEWR